MSMVHPHMMPVTQQPPHATVPQTMPQQAYHQVAVPVQPTPNPTEMVEQMRVVNLIKEAWFSWQKAMEGGWVEEWVNLMCADNVVVCDRIPRTQQVIVGKPALCVYYNKLIKKAWGFGCVMTWHTNRIEATSMNTVLCDYNVVLRHPSGQTLSNRHGDVIQVHGDKITNIVFNQLQQQFPAPAPTAGPASALQQHPGVPAAAATAAAPTAITSRLEGQTFVVNKEVSTVDLTWERFHNTPSQVQAKDLICHSFQAWQRAMEGGWVAEWITTFCSTEIKLCDMFLSAAKGRSKMAEGVDQLVQYYNRLLEVQWGQNAIVQWKAKGFYEFSPEDVAAHFMVTCRNTYGVVTCIECFFTFKLCGSRISEIVICPTETTLDSIKCRMGAAPVRPSTARGRQARVRPGAAAAAAAAGASCENPAAAAAAAAAAVRPPQQQARGRTLLPIGSDVGSEDEKKEKERVVQLTRPCEHNSWDNVRIKRGWLVLRCRVCHGQWRQRPTEIQRCAGFTEGTCALDKDCPQLHVHHIKHTKAQRELVKQEAEKALEFLKTTEGLACVAALAILTTSHTPTTPKHAPSRRRTHTCPPAPLEA